jgi:hypothetical protein
MPLITRGPIIPAAAVGSTATAGLLRHELHLDASSHHASAGTPVAIFGSLMASPLAQRNAAAPSPQPGQPITLRARWYVPGEGEVGDTVATVETDRAGLFGVAVLARDCPVDYTAVVDGPEGQPPLATSDPVRVTPA